MKNNMNDIFGGFSFSLDDIFQTKTHEVKTVDNKVILSIIAPGHKKENFTIELKGYRLYITMPEDTKRIFKLPPTVSLDDITAEYDAGILKIKFDKKEEETRKITIL